MTTTSLSSADSQQLRRLRAPDLLNAILTLSSDGMIAAGCVVGVVSPSILLTRRFASSASRPGGRWTR